MKHLIESLTSNTGIGREAYNMKFMQKVYNKPDLEFLKRFSHHIGIDPSNKLFDEIKKLITSKFDKGADVSREIFYYPFMTLIEINGSKDDFTLDLADITNDDRLAIIELNCFKDVYKELDKMFSKYTTTFLNIYEDKRLPYRYYSWKDCKILLQDL